MKFIYYRVRALPASGEGAEGRPEEEKGSRLMVSLLLLNGLAPQRTTATKLILSTFLLSTFSKAGASFAFRGVTTFSSLPGLWLPDLPGPQNQIMATVGRQPTRRSARLLGTRNGVQSGDVGEDDRRLEMSEMKVVDLKDKLRLVGDLDGAGLCILPSTHILLCAAWFARQWRQV